MDKENKKPILVSKESISAIQAILGRAYAKNKENMGFYNSNIGKDIKKIYSQQEFIMQGFRNRLDEIGLLWSDFLGISFNEAMKELEYFFEKAMETKEI